MVKKKECEQCDRLLPVKSFHTNNRNKDGLQTYCQECMNDLARAYWHSEKGQVAREKANKANKVKREDKKKEHERTIKAWHLTKLIPVTYNTVYTSDNYKASTRLQNKKGSWFTILGKNTTGDTKTKYVIQFDDAPPQLTATPIDPRNRNFPSVCDIGFMGYGKYTQARNVKAHSIWRGIIHTIASNGKFSIDKSWYNFQTYLQDIRMLPNYTTWLQNNSYELSPDDQLYYSKETCVFVPRKENKARMLRIVKDKVYIDYKKKQICDSCRISKPFNSAMFPFVGITIFKELQTTCKACRIKQVSRASVDRKQYGRELTTQEREDIKQKQLDKIQRQKQQRSDTIAEEKRLKKEIYNNTEKPTHHLCSCCGETKEFTEEFFSKNLKGTRWGLRTVCKVCRSSQRKKSAQNKVTVVPETKTCSECHIEKPCTTKHYKATKKNSTGFEARCRECSKPYEAIRRKRRQKLPIPKLHKKISGGIFKHLTSLYGSKGNSITTDYLGCTTKQLIAHFNTGEFTHDDYLTNTTDKTLFHIDHIIPKKYYEPYLLFDEDNKPTKECTTAIKKCWNYRNLRILPATDNMIKSDVLDYDLVNKYKIRDLL